MGLMKCISILLLLLYMGTDLGAEATVAEDRRPSATFIAPAAAPQNVPAAVPTDTIPLTDSVLIADVILLNHKRTRSRVIFREMTFGRGSVIARKDFEEEIALTYSNLMNMGLFNRVIITHSDTLLQPGQEIVTIDFLETWYLYPVPVFSLADRNFNFWWRDQNRSLDRVNIGGKLTYYNFTGRRDRFKLEYTTGYTRKYEAAYRLPYLNKSGSIGFSVNYNFRQRREQNYETVDNQQSFYQDRDQFVYSTSDANLSLTYRRRLYVSHDVQLGYRNSSIADTIAEVLNPEFFGNGQNSQEFFRASYRYRNDRRDVRNYPWKGYYLEASLAKDGLGITGERSGLTGGITVRKFWPVSEKLSLNAGFGGKFSFIRSRQPFLENRAIGFGNNGIVGYQFYVVDGLDMAIWRFGIRRQLFKKELDLGKLAIIRAFRYIPIRVLLAFQFNQGIANAPFAGAGNQLNNTLLTGASFGLDVVLLYDMVGSLQYNHNHLGEGGVFLSLDLNF